LVEVLVGFTLFALTMTAVMWMTILAQRTGQSARNRMEALQHARATLEGLLSEPYSSGKLSVGRHTVNHGGFSGVYMVTEPDPNERKRVVLEMAYPSFNDTAQVELQLDISNALH